MSQKTVSLQDVIAEVRALDIPSAALLGQVRTVEWRDDGVMVLGMQPIFAQAFAQGTKRHDALVAAGARMGVRVRVEKL